MTMAIQTQQEPPKHPKTQKTPKHVGANGSHDDMVALKVDVAVLKEQSKNFATKEDIARLEVQIAQARAESNENIAKLETKIAKLEVQIAQARAESNENIAKLEAQIAQARAENKEDINQLLEAINRAALRVIVALMGVIVALSGILVTLILK